MPQGKVKKADISITDAIFDFENLRISALTKAAQISPSVKEVTIGPQSPIKKEVSNDMEPLVCTNINSEDNLIADKVSEDLRHTLICKEYESQLHEISFKIYRELIEKMISDHEKYYKRPKDSSSIQEQKSRKLNMLQRLYANDNLIILEEAKVDEQQSLIHKQTIENEKRILEEQKLSAGLALSIIETHSKICICDSEIKNLTMVDPLAKPIVEKYSTTIKTVMENMSVIVNLCQSGTVTDKEAKLAEILYLNIDNIKKKILEELNEAKQQEILRLHEQVRQQEDIKLQEQIRHQEQIRQKDTARQKELEEHLAIDAEKTVTEIPKALSVCSNKVKPQFYSSSNYNHYEELKKYLNDYENKYKDLLDNVNLKKFRFECQKAVNTPVNAISSVNGMHMRDKFDKLSKLLKGERVQVLDSFVMASQHPQGVFYCTALLAKKIVRQGDLLVSSNPEAAFPLATITVALWSQFPEFGKLLEAYFYKFCPYLVPMFLPQKEGQTDKEFYLSRGYTYNDEGVVEKQDKFLKRMSGIFKLCCAIWMSDTPRFLNSTNPHGLKYGWRWLASFINLRPEPDICATLLYDFFTICGSAFIKSYRKQCYKIITLICTDYFSILQNIDEGGPKTRLEVFLQNVLKTGTISPPDGQLSQNFW